MVLKKTFENSFSIHKENSHIIIKIFGIKFTFKSLKVNPLEDMCNIVDLKELLKNGTKFPHPIGIVIGKGAKIGKNCTIYQNTTIGNGKYNKTLNSHIAVIGNNVTIFANCNIIGGVSIGDNAIIGAGSVVINDIEANTVVAGNPAKFIRKIK